MRAVATDARGPADAPRVARGVAEIAHPVATAADLDPLLDLIGDVHFALLGEASHGTSEFLLHMPVRVDGELPETYPSGV